MSNQTSTKIENLAAIFSRDHTSHIEKLVEIVEKMSEESNKPSAMIGNKAISSHSFENFLTILPLPNSSSL